MSLHDAARPPRYDQVMTPHFSDAHRNGSQRIRYVILDLFHTLVSVHGSKPETHTLLGVEYDVYRAALFGDAADRLTGRAADPVAVVADLARKSGSSVSPETYEEIAAARLARFRRASLNVLPEILDALARIRHAGIVLALISNADVTEVAGWYESPLSAFFSEVLMSCWVGLAKPDPGIYEECIRRLGATPDEAIFVGDGGSNEFSGAAQCSIQTVCTTEFISRSSPQIVPERQAAADTWVSSISELADVLTAQRHVC